MVFKKNIRCILMVLLVVSMLLLGSCSDGNKGNMTDEGNVSKSGATNVVKDEEAIKLTGGYFNWLTAEAFDGFSEAIVKTKLPKVIEEAFSEVAENKKISRLKGVFCPNELFAAIQTAYEYENKSNTYTHNVTSISKSSDGVYKIELNLTVGSQPTNKKYELSLSKETRKIRLSNFNEKGEEQSFIEIVVTNDGYIAVNRAGVSSGNWGFVQLMFKGGENAEGYCTCIENQKEKPKSIYTNSVYSGFAGKK
ncbi:MAG: hypothetical protein E7614_04290 [Ruminococcaceae bacterium]|nr:hypothetical protein [Oscillospiraceae bacterium]